MLKAPTLILALCERQVLATAPLDPVLEMAVSGRVALAFEPWRVKLGRSARE